MPNVIIIHGAYGTPEENWFPWLGEQLEEIGCSVYIPQFPTPKGQSLESWFEAFKPFEKYLDSETILIGHSIGATFILNILQKFDKKTRAAFLVSGFVRPAVDPNNEVTEINKTFYAKKFNWAKIKKNCKDFFVINSDNDKYVPLNFAEELSEPLEVTLTVIEGAGHFNTKMGYDKFPQLFDMVEDILTMDPKDS